MITKEKAVEIIEKFDFFQGQRAGRELWADKPKEVQEKDIEQFQKDCAALKEYVQKVEPQGWIPVSSGRLTKRNPDGSAGIANFTYHNFDDFQRLVNKLAHYEDLAAQGRLAYLPQPYKESK